MVTDFVKRLGLWLIEDCCDAVGSLYDGKPVGTFGDLMTVSYYPAHPITLGESGWLIWADSFHPDWKAYAGGQEIPVYRVNLAFKAVRVEPGTQKILFVFGHGFR